MPVRRLGFVSLGTFDCYFWQSLWLVFLLLLRQQGFAPAIERAYLYLPVWADYRPRDTFVSYLMEQFSLQFVFSSGYREVLFDVFTQMLWVFLNSCALQDKCAENTVSAVGRESDFICIFPVICCFAALMLDQWQVGHLQTWFLPGLIRISNVCTES